jgi:hypothetical protein
MAVISGRQCGVGRSAFRGGSYRQSQVTVGHDVEIGNFALLCRECGVSGGCKVGEGALLVPTLVDSGRENRGVGLRSARGRRRCADVVECGSVLRFNR